MGMGCCIATGGLDEPCNTDGSCDDPASASCITTLSCGGPEGRGCCAPAGGRGEICNPDNTCDNPTVDSCVASTYAPRALPVVCRLAAPISPVTATTPATSRSPARAASAPLASPPAANRRLVKAGSRRAPIASRPHLSDPQSPVQILRQSLRGRRTQHHRHGQWRRARPDVRRHRRKWAKLGKSIHERRQALADGGHRRTGRRYPAAASMHQFPRRQATPATPRVRVGEPTGPQVCWASTVRGCVRVWSSVIGERRRPRPRRADEIAGGDFLPTVSVHTRAPCRCGLPALSLVKTLPLFPDETTQSATDPRVQVLQRTDGH